MLTCIIMDELFCRLSPSWKSESLRSLLQTHTVPLSKKRKNVNHKLICVILTRDYRTQMAWGNSPTKPEKSWGVFLSNPGKGIKYPTRLSTTVQAAQPLQIISLSTELLRAKSRNLFLKDFGLFSCSALETTKELWEMSMSCDSGGIIFISLFIQNQFLYLTFCLFFNKEIVGFFLSASCIKRLKSKQFTNGNQD